MMERKINLKKSNKEKEELKNNENVSENVNETETAGGCSPEGCAGCSGCGGNNMSKKEELKQQILVLLWELPVQMLLKVHQTWF